MKDSPAARRYRHRPGPREGVYAPAAFSILSLLSMAVLCGRAGRFTAKHGGSRPLVPPPVWSTIYYSKRLLVPVLQY
jgi:hypothetical protein